jgi:(E)-4-hydroxy-3-methylbut-2-enyl-diphosphate synthase
MLHSSTDMGALLLDGLGDGVMMRPEKCGTDEMVNRTASVSFKPRTHQQNELHRCPARPHALRLQRPQRRSRTDQSRRREDGIVGCIVNGQVR